MAAQKYHRLVFGRRTAGHEHDPTLLKFEDSGSASIFADQRRPKSIAINSTDLTRSPTTTSVVSSIPGPGKGRRR
jgi:hypothetical protein